MRSRSKRHGPAALARRATAPRTGRAAGRSAGADRCDAHQHTPIDRLARELEAQRKAADALADDDAKRGRAAGLPAGAEPAGREAQQRFLLRALYSTNQLQEQMTWFWMNHFNVSTRKGNMRELVGDYEETAIRPQGAGALPRPAGRDGVPSGDAALPRQRAERRRPAQRELSRAS
jgi:uncharacterized protein (DUF1800 family)